MSTNAEWRDYLPITYHEVVDEIVRFSGLPKTEVEHRVWMQALEPGWNIIQDVERFNVTPFQFDENILRLYTQGDGFIFDSLVFWARPARQLWIQHALTRIKYYSERVGIPLTDLKVLMHGDGPGNDSIFLASNGLTVDYFELPGSRTFIFAVDRFKYHGFWNRNIRLVDNYPEGLHGQYDVVISFEVLEHLPDPLTNIQEINCALKIGGIALITEDFGDLLGYLPTHLKKSARFLGTAPFLFLKHNLLLTWYSQDEMFKPYEFVKVERNSINNWLLLMRDFNVRSRYLSRYTGTIAKFIQKLPYFRIKKHA